MDDSSALRWVAIAGLAVALPFIACSKGDSAPATPASVDARDACYGQIESDLLGPHGSDLIARPTFARQLGKSSQINLES